MDLAIGVAVGSSIQIALFVTPVVVLLGWILQKDMSLYFSLFETISLFVSAFIISESYVSCTPTEIVNWLPRFPDSRRQNELPRGRVTDRSIRDHRSCCVFLPRL